MVVEEIEEDFKQIDLEELRKAMDGSAIPSKSSKEYSRCFQKFESFAND